MFDHEPRKNPEARAEFGDRLRAALEARGLTQAEAGRRLGVNPVQVARWLSGVRAPSAPRLAEVVAALGLDPAILFPEPAGGRRK